REEEAQQSTAARIGVAVSVALFFFIFLGGCYFGRRNLHQGRGDRKGALQVSVGVAIAAMASWGLHSHYVASAPDELGMFINGMAASLLAGFSAWGLYIMLEPFVRRNKPQILISWSRLLAGQCRDPLVGRDLLVGGLGGALMAFGVCLDNAIPYWFDFPVETPMNVTSTALGSSREALSALLALLLNSVVSSLVVLTIFFLLRVLLRIEWLSVLLTGVFVLLINLGTESFKLELPVALLIAAVTVFLLVRFGILALLFAQFYVNLIVAAPITFDFFRWYAGRGVFVLLLLLGSWLWGLRLALGGRPMLKLALDD